MIAAAIGIDQRCFVYCGADRCVCSASQPQLITPLAQAKADVNALLELCGVPERAQDDQWYARYNEIAARYPA